MLQADLIQRMKRTNVSVDPEKTKQRVFELWKGSANKHKKLVEQDSGSARTSIYRVYNTGAISAKLAVSMAQRLNCDPFYIIGETDENNECTDETVEKFLQEQGYAQLLKSAMPRVKRKYTRRKELEFERPARTEEDEEEETPHTSDPLADAQLIANIGEDELKTLLDALVIRARTSEDSRKRLDRVKQLLVR